MGMKSTKYIMSGGFAVAEEKDMDKLGNYAKKGWLLESVTPFGYKMRRSEPQNLVYSLDYQTNVDEDYDLIFEDAGWTRVCSVGGTHFFRAAAGTTPIFTDKATIIDKYQREKKVTGTIALPSLIALIVFVLLGRMSDNGRLPEIVGDISLILGLLSLFIAIFSGFPHIACQIKLHNLRK